MNQADREVNATSGESIGNVLPSLPAVAAGNETAREAIDESAVNACFATYDSEGTRSIDAVSFRESATLLAE